MLPLFMAVAGQLGGLSWCCNSGNGRSVRWFALVRAHNAPKKPESEISGCEIRMVYDACAIAIRHKKHSATDGFASADCWARPLAAVGTGSAVSRGRLFQNRDIRSLFGDKLLLQPGISVSSPFNRLA